LKPRLTESRILTRNGRTWLHYPELDLGNLLHGIVVFKDAPLGQAYDQWAKAASAFVIEHATQVWRTAPAGRSAAVRQVVIPRQVHGRDIKTVRAAGLDPIASNPTCDGLVTDEPGLALGVSVADCIPLLAACSGGAIGVAHCGWRGTAGGVVEEFVRALATMTGKSDGTTYVIGAGIGHCCYEVREDLLREFPAHEAARFSERRGRSTFFDLKQLVAARLIALGVEPAKISIDKTCTACQKYSLSSFRREGVKCGRMLAFLAMTG
jgi:YfiH family protein